MSDTVILSAEDSAAIKRIRDAEQELNAAIQALALGFNVQINTLDINRIGVPDDREMICVNLSKAL